MIKRIVSLFLTIVLLSAAFPISASAADWTRSSEFGALPNLSGTGISRLTTYSTAARDSYNATNLELSGSFLTVRRSGIVLHTRPDQITLTQSGAVLLEQPTEWYTLATGSYGYETALDLSALPEGRYTLHIVGDHQALYPVLDVAVLKDATGCYFPKDTTLSRQYNYDLLRKLEAGAPNDFAALKELYDEKEYEQDLKAIEAKALELTRGRSGQRDKAVAIYKWLVENIAYDMDLSGNAYYRQTQSDANEEIRLQDPLHAFSQKYALCYGFARLTTLMMGYAGIDCVYITGRLADTSTNSINAEITSPDLVESWAMDAMNHAWNAVRLDGGWYFIDPSRDALNNYFRTDKGNPSTGYTVPNKGLHYQHVFPSLNQLSATHIALRVGVKNYGTKLSATPVPDGWVKSGETSAYFYKDGVLTRNTWQKIDGEVYRFDQSGLPLKGWQLVDKFWRYFGGDGALLIGAQTIKEGNAEQEFRFDANGRLTGNGFVTFAGSIRYLKGTELLTGWQCLGGHWHYFTADGALYRDSRTPLETGDQLFHFTEEGYLKIEGSGWVTLGGKRSYLDETTVRTGLQRIDGRDYYLDDSGVPLTGWQSTGGKTLYYQDGTPKTGWMFLDGSWYYVDSAKGRYTGAQAVGGATYFFDAQGRLSAGGWVNVGTGRLYFAEGQNNNGVQMGGKMLRGWQKVDGELRYFDPTDGRMYTGTEQKYNENSKRYYTFSSDGVATLVPLS